MQWTEASADDFDSIDREGEKEGGRERKGDGREGRRSTVRERREKLSSSKAIQNSPKKTREDTQRRTELLCSRALLSAADVVRLWGNSGMAGSIGSSFLQEPRGESDPLESRGNERISNQTQAAMVWADNTAGFDKFRFQKRWHQEEKNKDFKNSATPPPPPFDGCIRKRLPRDWMCAD